MNSKDFEQTPIALLGINNCDKEQILIPGSVQRFGALVCFDEHQRINRCSENLAELLGLDINELAGQDAAKIFAEEDLAEIMKPRKIEWQYSRVKMRSGLLVDCMRQAHGAESYLDIIPVRLERKPSNSLIVLRDFVSRAQARELYKRNKVRIVHDVNAAQSKVVDFSANVPLDMSFSFVRSVSEIHLQYLRNMDVAASMSLSLFEDRKFLGLVACHNRSPLALTFEDAALFESLTDIYSTRLSELKKHAIAERRLRSADAVQDLVRHVSSNSSITELFENPGAIHEMIRANGFVIALGNQIVKHGAVPDNPTIDRIVAWLEKGSENMAAFDDFPDRFARDVRAYASGLLAAKNSINTSFMDNVASY